MMTKVYVTSIYHEHLHRRGHYLGLILGYKWACVVLAGYDVARALVEVAVSSGSVLSIELHVLEV